jgi:hypothetical protein
MCCIFRSFSNGANYARDLVITKKYAKHELQRLSFKRKEIRKRKFGAVGRYFKLDI